MNATRPGPNRSRPRGQAPAPRAAAPDEAGENRLALAATTDALIALIVGLALSQRVFPASDGVAEFLGAFVPCVLAVSFANHVLGTLLLRGSLAKLVFGMRVVRWKDGRRPRIWQTVARWLFGFVVIGLQYLLEGASVGQACGLRTVRRRDQRHPA
ncbi:RDD family protein [Nocardia exalbida]|uniref:RDD family protein n=1 Tax=Nocardia exalbida TaxID=290231 RepID=UPI00068404C5|nr:RDD family protein [Nocardia exalbida]